ncbi:solute carrier family 23 protein [Proteiniclasticum sp. QWL-01]|uniref:uracil-xanthine permease family protein n=1 Tax=Proteiniclasticum sp. QWL-01 TaxID=3036945 RepID=UPI0021FBD079|nr:solute carrier family 23 protein [Proteiniclasticum sp. QWL-01]UUM11456.1 xanthine permease [Clostridiaceae bacterium HFYG-1003]WFF72868.1 solute carrier family 23 protein [Proteiniclasticum sp. QWL-01]
MTNKVHGYLPDETPRPLELLFFALQQIIVMFPATVLVALLTGFNVSTTIFASGLATLCFILVTGRKIPLYYGSSFSYIAAITSITMGSTYAHLPMNERISIAQFGIMMSGFVSIIAGFIIRRYGRKLIDRLLPASVTGPIAIIIGLSLAGSAMSNATAVPASVDPAWGMNWAWVIAIATLLSTILYSVYLKGRFSQLPILFGLLTGYGVAIIVQMVTKIPFISFDTIQGAMLQLPVITLPKPTFVAVAAIMPIALATIPESTAHIFQLHIYVNNLAKKKGSTKVYDLENRLGDNLIGDGIGDIVSAAIGGPAGTNYGENISAMAISKNFSVNVLITAAILTMVISSFTPLVNAVYSIPAAVIGGLSIYLFGVIAAQGIAIIIEKQVDMFSSKNLAIISVILIIGLGGSFYFPESMIPFFGVRFPAIATAAIVGILLNLLLSLGNQEEPVIVDEDVDLA